MQEEKNEEVRYLTLHELNSAKGIAAPAILIVGEVARQDFKDASNELEGVMHPMERSLNDNSGIRIQASNQSQ